MVTTPMWSSMCNTPLNFSTSTGSDFSRRLFFIRLFCSRAPATVQKTLPWKYQFHFRKLHRHIVRPPPSHNNWSAPRHHYFLHDWKLRADHWSCAGNVCMWLATETRDSVLGFRFAHCNFTCETSCEESVSTTSFGCSIGNGLRIFDYFCVQKPSTIKTLLREMWCVKTLCTHLSVSYRILWIYLPPSNSGKWRLGFPTKNVIILVVTVTGWGIDLKDTVRCTVFVITYFPPPPLHSARVRASPPSHLHSETRVWWTQMASMHPKAFCANRRWFRVNRMTQTSWDATTAISSIHVDQSAISSWCPFSRKPLSHDYVFRHI